MKVLIRRNAESAATPDEAVALLGRVKSARVISRSGMNILADIESSALAALESQLTGWIVSPQGDHAPIPDARIKIG